MAPVLLRAAFLLLAVVVAGGAAAFPEEANPTKSGYLNVPSGSLYFAFYEAAEPLSGGPTPLILWLQGGPGCSSLVGAFFELGPFVLTESAGERRLERNPFSWNRRFGVIFLDSPLGAGFSAAPSNDTIPGDEAVIANDIASALQGFVSLDGSYRSRPLYIAGESYAGKFVPFAGQRVLELNAGLPENQRLNLQGIAIGNGMTHPVVQVTKHAAVAYSVGLINDAQRAELEKLQDESAQLATEEKWVEAAGRRSKVLRQLKKTAGLATTFDYTRQKPYEYKKALHSILNERGAKKKLRAKEDVEWKSCSSAVKRTLHGDVMKSAKPAVEAAVAAVRVLLYQGMYDLNDGPVSTEAWVKEMNWDGGAAFAAAPHAPWELDNGDRAGYVQQSGNLALVAIAGTGHMAPADNGAAAQAMIEKWVLQTPFVDGISTETTEQARRRRSS